MPKLNKKGKLAKTYVKYGVLGDAIKYGIPIGYITYAFNLFKFNDDRVSLTGWAFLIIIIGITFFRQKIKDIVEEWDNGLGNMSSHIKSTTAWVVVFGIFWGVIVAASLVLWLTFVFAASNALSIYPYSIYYKKKDEYNEVMKIVNEHQNKDKAAEVEMAAKKILKTEQLKKEMKATKRQV